MILSYSEYIEESFYFNKVWCQNSYKSYDDKFDFIMIPPKRYITVNKRIDPTLFKEKISLYMMMS